MGRNRGEVVVIDESVQYCTVSSAFHDDESAEIIGACHD
ncbi:hypothetical protein KCH_77090 [Kitasatospora cheerisanensis KCTC 2395]|uniref:Uncharacterized protein n=1 Tax=Kitasatospora cheerisanensis KCTC 2395 TaxID=1348663 RepID=A0A066YHE7_9ACTN|nr:hypothetical protein KCH_77090 [Kitasatospora cheerisanensis KCTC 2395]